MSATRTDLQPASFRGIRFFVDNADTAVGRRNVIHEYPLKDTPYAEDLGRAARIYSINAYVMGDDCYEQARALIKAVEEDGSPGVLVHPTLGRRNVVPKDCRSIFNNQEGRIAYIALSFTEAGENQFPKQSFDTQTNAHSVADKSKTKIKTAFSDLFATSGFQDVVANRAINLLRGETDLSQGGSLVPQPLSFVGVLTSVLGRFAGDTVKYSTLRNSITDFQNTLATTITNPQTLAEEVDSLIKQLADIYTDARTLLAALKQLYDQYGQGISPISLTTPAVPVATLDREQLVINQSQLIDLIHNLVLLEMVKAVANIDFESRDEALLIMRDIESRMQPELTYLGDGLYDDAFIALSESNTSMILDIKTRAATLKTIAYITINDPMPALVLAYREYQDAKQESDIVARNKVRNPVFVPSGRELEILV